MASRLPDSRAWTVTWIVAAWALLATDLLVPQVNISSVYVVALVVFLLASGRTSIWRPALAMSACVIVGYLFKSYTDLGGLGDRLASVRLANRLFVVCVLLATASLAPRLQPSLEPDAWRRWTETEGGIGDEELFRDLGRSVAGISAIALFAAILLFEILAPVTLNLTLLAPISLLLALRTTRRRLVLALTACIVALPLAGYALEMLGSGAGIPWLVLANRILATLAWAGLAAALYLGVLRDRSSGAASGTTTVPFRSTPPSDDHSPVQGR